MSSFQDTNLNYETSCCYYSSWLVLPYFRVGNSTSVECCCGPLTASELLQSIKSQMVSQTLPTKESLSFKSRSRQLREKPSHYTLPQHNKGNSTMLWVHPHCIKELSF